MSRSADQGLALWNAVLEAARVFPYRSDVMAVGQAGGEVVVIRVHVLDQNIFNEPTEGNQQ